MLHQIITDYAIGFPGSINTLNYVHTQNITWDKGTYSPTIMHSSRMRTVRCSGRFSCHAYPPPPATHAPCHACPYHTCPLTHTHTPIAMHAPSLTHTPLPCMPPLPCMSSCHTCPLATHAPPMHTPCHACLPLPHIPPAMHTPLPHMSPWPHMPPSHARPPLSLVKTLTFRKFCCGR